MAPTPFFCNECHMDLDESNIRHHISAMHLNYFPYKCFACKGKGINYETLSAELMYEHTSTVHVEAVPDVRLFMDREDELNAAVENCRRPPAEQVSLNESKHAIRQVFISLGDTLTDTRDDTSENEVISTEIKQEDDNIGVHESASNDNVGEDTGLNEIDSPIPPVLSIEPTAIIETQQNASDPITNSDNISALNAMPLPKPEPSGNVSIVPVGLRLEAALSSYVPIDVEANEAQHNSVVVATGRASRITRRKANTVSSNSAGNPERSATSQLRKPSMPLKKRSRNELENIPQLEANSIESPKPRRESLKKKQSAGPASGASTLPAQRSSEMHRTSASNSNKDRFQKPPTSVQAVLDVPIAPAEKMKIAWIWIIIYNGKVKFKTSEGQTFHSRPLCEYVSILSQSEGVLGCEAYMISECPRKWDGHESVRKKFEEFSREIHSIAHLWANGRVMALLDGYPVHESKVLPVPDFCNGLFGENRSILACNQLIITLGKNWPFSVVTNAARRCNELILKEIQHGQRLHYKLLDAFYERKIPQHIEVTLGLRLSESTNEFIEELKKRFQYSKEENFKLTLLLPLSNALSNMRLDNEHGLALTTTTKVSHKKDCDCVMIVQHSVL